MVFTKVEEECSKSKPATNDAIFQSFLVGQQMLPQQLASIGKVVSDSAVTAAKQDLGVLSDIAVRASPHMSLR